jgi:diguanylate cyclase (GGDEF)-like protein
MRKEQGRSMPGSTEEQRWAGTAQAETVRVLLVEDNPGDDRLIRLALSEDPYRKFEVTRARTLRDGLELAQTLPLDAILLDLHLPDSSGLANVKTLALAVPRTPILVITGLDDDSLAIQVCEHGAQAYLIKGNNQPVALSRAIRCAMARKRFEALLAQQAYFDSLTGLANRGLFHDRLKQALARATRADKRIAVVFIDLDNFKAVNDNFGHNVGDEVLRAIADALRAAVRQTDTVARLGGDEFTVLVEPLNDLTDAETVAQKILSAVHASIKLAGAPVRLTASIGVVLFPDHARNADSLVESADKAMFFAKKRGGNRIQLLVRGNDPSTAASA